MLHLLPPVNVFWVLADVLEIVSLLILIDVILSWARMLGALALPPWHPWVRALRKVTSPLLDPIRRVIPPSRTSGWDLSPVVALLVLNVVTNVLVAAGAQYN